MISMQLGATVIKTTKRYCLYSHCLGFEDKYKYRLSLGPEVFQIWEGFGFWIFYGFY